MELGCSACSEKANLCAEFSSHSLESHLPVSQQRVSKQRDCLQSARSELQVQRAKNGHTQEGIQHYCHLCRNSRIANVADPLVTVTCLCVYCSQQKHPCCLFKWFLVLGFVSFILFLRQGLATEWRLVLNSQSFCLHFPGT